MGLDSLFKNVTFQVPNNGETVCPLKVLGQVFTPVSEQEINICKFIVELVPRFYSHTLMKCESS